MNDRTAIEVFLKSRDESSFLAIYRLYTPRLMATAMRLLNWNKLDAEDVLQTAWLRAVSQISEFRFESTFSTWIVGILINCCRELRREKHYEVLLDDDVLEAHVPDPAVNLDIEKALLALAPGYREILILHDVYGHTHEEIGRILGIETGTSKSQLHHARKSMREMLNI